MKYDSDISIKYTYHSLHITYEAINGNKKLNCRTEHTKININRNCNFAMFHVSMHPPNKTDTCLNKNITAAARHPILCHQSAWKLCPGQAPLTRKPRTVIRRITGSARFLFHLPISRQHKRA